MELLWWEGCPSYSEALDDLRAAMAELGLDPGDVDVRETSPRRRPVERGFPGSPTIRVDGADVQPPRTASPRG